MKTKLVNAKTYALLHDTTDLLENITRGEKAIEEKRTTSHHQAKKRMKRWLK